MVPIFHGHSGIQSPHIGGRQIGSHADLDMFSGNDGGGCSVNAIIGNIVCTTQRYLICATPRKHGDEVGVYFLHGIFFEWLKVFANR